MCRRQPDIRGKAAHGRRLRKRHGVCREGRRPGRAVCGQRGHSRRAAGKRARLYAVLSGGRRQFHRRNGRQPPLRPDGTAADHSRCRHGPLDRKHCRGIRGKTAFGGARPGERRVCGKSRDVEHPPRRAGCVLSRRGRAGGDHRRKRRKLSRRARPRMVFHQRSGPVPR